MLLLAAAKIIFVAIEWHSTTDTRYIRSTVCANATMWRNMTLSSLSPLCIRLEEEAVIRETRQARKKWKQNAPNLRQFSCSHDCGLGAFLCGATAVGAQLRQAMVCGSISSLTGSCYKHNLPRAASSPFSGLSACAYRHPAEHTAAP